MISRVHLIKFAAQIAVVALAGLVASACASSPSPTIVQATLREWNMTLSSSSVPAGKITFQVANQGAVEHELVILRTDVAPAALAMDVQEPGKVAEDSSQVKDVGEVEAVAPGTSKSAVFELTPGKYVLVCNEATHYQAGMVAAFEVK